MERSNTPTREERVQWMKAAREVYTERSRAQQPHRYRRCASQSPRHCERTPARCKRAPLNPAATPTRRNMNIFARSDDALDPNLTFSKGKPVEEKNLFELDPNNRDEFLRMMQILDRVQEVKFRPFHESRRMKSPDPHGSKRELFEAAGLRIESLKLEKTLSQSLLRLRELPSAHQKSVLHGIDAASIQWLKNNINNL